MQSTPAPLDTDATQNIRSTDVQHAAESRAVPQVVGYELLDELGRGGMGVVYKACSAICNGMSP